MTFLTPLQERSLDGSLATWPAQHLRGKATHTLLTQLLSHGHTTGLAEGPGVAPEAILICAALTERAKDTATSSAGLSSPLQQCRKMWGCQGPGQLIRDPMLPPRVLAGKGRTEILSRL